MSHTLQIISCPDLKFTLTVVNYVAGGESVALSELASWLTSLDGLIFGTVPPNQNSLAVPLVPILSSGKIMLYRFVSGVPTEIPTTNALNAVISALIWAH